MTNPTPPAASTYPGKTLGIVGLVLAFVANFVGIIVSAIALSQSKKAGFTNTPAKVGLILSIIFFVFTVIGLVLFGSAIAALLSQCAGMEPGVYVLENGTTVTCG